MGSNTKFGVRVLFKPFAAKSVPLSRKSLAKILIQTSHYSKLWFTIQTLTHFLNVTTARKQ